jgi:hypothetical protein
MVGSTIPHSSSTSILPTSARFFGVGRRRPARPFRARKKGIVQRIPNRGSIVRGLTPREVIEIYSAREGLEVMASQRFPGGAQARPSRSHRHDRSVAVWPPRRSDRIDASAPEAVAAGLHPRIRAALRQHWKRLTIAQVCLGRLRKNLAARCQVRNWHLSAVTVVNRSFGFRGKSRRMLITRSLLS